MSPHIQRRTQRDNPNPFTFWIDVKSSCSEAKLAVPVTLINAFQYQKQKSADAPRRWQYPDSRRTVHPHLIVTKYRTDNVVATFSPTISIRLRLTSPSFISSSGCRYCCLKAPPPSYRYRVVRVTVHFPQRLLHQFYIGHQSFSFSRRA